MINALPWVLMVVMGLDILFFWYARLWLVLLNSVLSLGVTLLLFVNDADPKMCLIAVLATIMAGQSLYIAEEDNEDDLYVPEDFVDDERPCEPTGEECSCDEISDDTDCRHTLDCRAHKVHGGDL